MSEPRSVETFASANRTASFISSPWSSIVPALPFCHYAIRVTKPKSENYPKQLKTLGDHIRKCRLDRRLFQRQVAEVIGVHSLTVTNWERNATVPPMAYIPAIIRFLGYDPSPFKGGGS